MLDRDLERSTLDALIVATARLGVLVKEDWNEPEGGRFIGTISGRTITLYPKYDRIFALYFTVAHLYGHLAQLEAPTAEQDRAIRLVYRVGTELTADEVQCLYEYEWEAAAIGRRLIGEVEAIDPERDREYARYFHADFHYLVHFLETGQGGAETFERLLRREPKPRVPIPADGRPLRDLSHLEVTTGQVDVLVV